VINIVFLPTNMQYMTPGQLATIIKKRREILKITQEQLADTAEVGLRTLKSIESEKANPTIETVTKLAEVMGMELKLKIKPIKV